MNKVQTAQLAELQAQATRTPQEDAVVAALVALQEADRTHVAPAALEKARAAVETAQQDLEAV